MSDSDSDGDNEGLMVVKEAELVMKSGKYKSLTREPDKRSTEELHVSSNSTSSVDPPSSSRARPRKDSETGLQIESLTSSPQSEKEHRDSREINVAIKLPKLEGGCTSVLSPKGKEKRGNNSEEMDVSQSASRVDRSPKLQTTMGLDVSVKDRPSVRTSFVHVDPSFGEQGIAHTGAHQPSVCLDMMELCICSMEGCVAIEDKVNLHGLFCMYGEIPEHGVLTSNDDRHRLERMRLEEKKTAREPFNYIGACPFACFHTMAGATVQLCHGLYDCWGMAFLYGEYPHLRQVHPDGNIFLSCILCGWLERTFNKISGKGPKYAQQGLTSPAVNHH